MGIVDEAIFHSGLALRAVHFLLHLANHVSLTAKLGQAIPWANASYRSAAILAIRGKAMTK
jgi:hypothetical protein